MGGVLVGILFSAAAGMAMSVQGAMNAHLGEQVGLFESNAFVQGSAFVLSVLALLFFGKGNFGALFQVEKIYLLGGAIGFFITVSVMLGIQNLSPVFAISVILIAQLLIAAVIEAFGLLGSEKLPFLWNNYAGLLLMIGGVLLFKWDFA